MKLCIFVALIFLGIISIIVVSCVINQSQNHKGHPLYRHLSQIPDELPALNFAEAPVPTPSFQAYREYYQLDFSEVDHLWGTFTSGVYELVAHIFIPRHPRGSIFVLHGYLDHTGMLSRLIRNCIEQQFVVAVYDLPGHGLSTGERASIKQFSEYTVIFHTFFEQCRKYLPPPYHLISHSTGGAIAFDYLSNTTNHPFDKIIFLAPLVRYVHWHISKIAYTLGKILHIKTVPRRYDDDFVESEFAQFLRTDPLQPVRVPMAWVGALHDWNRKIQVVPEMTIPVLIIQGTRDSVVDWKYNIPFLQQKIARADVKWIQDAGHQLFNGMPEIQLEVFESVNGYLAGKNARLFP